MLSIGRGQENTPDRLRLFTVDGSGAALNPFLVRYRIFDNTGVGPVQVFPLAGYEVVTNQLGRFDDGAFYAYDNGNSRGWTPDAAANLGDWYIEWDVEETSGSGIVTTTVNFQMVESAAHATPDPLYIGVTDLRAEGIPNPPLAATLEKNVRTWQAFIVRACRQWFHPVHLDLVVDGTDSDALHFGVPIISVDEVRINNDPSPLTTDKYRVYTAARYPDNTKNPRIKLIDEFADRRDIFTAPFESGRHRFRKGRMNQFISGDFGCVEADGSVPLLIQRALLKLVVEKSTTPVFVGPPGVSPPPSLTGVVTEEWTDGHKIKYDVSSSTTLPRSPGLTGITKDQEILDIIKMFKAPIGLATPSDPSVARGA